MQITFICPACHAEWAADASAAGSSVECPTCKQTITVPKKGHGPGVILGGFKILKLLGKGGMGEVYLAQQMSMGRNVALKILPGSLSMEKSMVERFFKEVRLLAQLDHPNIVTAYEAGEDTDILYLAMAYVDGDPMEERLKKQGPMKEKEALQIVYKLAGALDYAWSKFQILHRDIKPGNILQTTDGEVKLADLGLAKSLTESVETTMSGTILGTPNYMSPEQINAQADLDCRTDMYSMGATLYHLLTGRIPFGGSTLMETLRKQLDDNLPDPREYQPELSEGCVRLMEIMMAKDREQRHADWKVLKADVERVLHGEEPLKEPLPPGSSVLMRSDGIPKKAVVAGKRAPGKTSAVRFNTKLIAIAAGILLVVVGAAVLFRALRSSPTVVTPPQTATATVAANEQKAEALPVSSNTPPAETTVEAKPDQAGALAKLSRQYADAVTFTRDHPEEYTGALAMFEMLKKTAEGTEYEAKITEEIQRLTLGRKKAVDKFIEALKEKVNADVEAGKYEEALKRLEDNTESMAKDTETARAEMAKEVREKQKSTEETTSQQQAEEQRKKQAEEARSKLAESLESIVTDLMKGDYAAAVQTASALRANEVFGIVSNEVETLNELVGEVATLPEVVLKSLEQDKQKKEVAIEFRTGQTERVQLLSVGEKTFKVKRQVGAGSMERDFAISDLSYKEKLKRLGDDPRPQRAIMRGLVASQSGDGTRAEKEFASAGGMLGDALGEAVNKRTSAKTKVSVQKQAKADNKTEESDVAPAATSGAKPSAGGKSVPMKNATKENVEEALANLVKDNPGLENVSKSYTIEANGIKMDLSKKSNLKDISALAGLPLVELKMKETNVKDLSPLCDMPLKSLDVGYTRVMDLAPLAGMQIAQLTLDRTEVNDLTPLKGMPLRQLALNFTKVNDLKPLIGMPLAFINLFAGSVSDISPLKDMNSLSSLNLCGTRVTDFSPIKHLQVKYLTIGNEKEKISLKPFDGMPVTTLYISFADNVIDIDKTPDYFPDVKELSIMGLSSNPGFILRFQNVQTIQLGKDAGAQFEDADKVKEYIKKTFPSSEAKPSTGLKSQPASTKSTMPGKKPGKGTDQVPQKEATKKSVEEALTKLVEDNPGLKDTDLTYTIQDNGITMNLINNRSKLKDLSSLCGMPLKQLLLQATHVMDLAPLTGMPLELLDLYGTTSVSDISPLKDMVSLKDLNVARTMVTDFSPIKHLQLRSLYIGNEKEKINLKPFDGMPVISLNIEFADNIRDIDKIPDYFPDVQTLSIMGLSSNPEFILRFNNLQKIQLGKDVQFEDMDQFKEYLKKTFPSSEAKPSTGLKSQPASTKSTMLGKKPGKGTDQTPQKEATKKTVEEALANLVKDNPGLKDVSKSYTIQGNGIVMDLSQNPNLEDISALAGLPLVNLNLTSTNVKDLSPLRGMPLKILALLSTKVYDLKPLIGMPLDDLSLFYATSVTDLSPLKDMVSLTVLNIGQTMVTDFSPIKHLQLKYLCISPYKEKISLKQLDGMPVTILAIGSVDNVIDIDKIPDYFPDVKELRVQKLPSNPGFILRFRNLNKIQPSDTSPSMDMDQFKEYLKKTFPSSEAKPTKK